jgi:DNA replication protein DnaC
MTAFLKIDNCNTCHRSLPWDWVPAVLLNGKTMAGTGVWRSQLIRGRCSACSDILEFQRQNEQRATAVRRKLVDLLGGEKPYREFTFGRYQVMPGNQVAFEASKGFNPGADNLYLWGPCGVGKTHLAYAAARCSFEETSSLAIVRAYQLSRHVRLKGPEHEQEAIQELVDSDVLVMDALGIGVQTTYSRQLLQEILDSRHFADRAGLIVTSPYSLDALARQMDNDSIPSRLGGMCRVVGLRGRDHRLISGGTIDA